MSTLLKIHFKFKRVKLCDQKVGIIRTRMLKADTIFVPVEKSGEYLSLLYLVNSLLSVRNIS